MKLKRIFRALTSPSDLVTYLILRMKWAERLSDERFLRMIYFIKFHKWLNLKDPQTYNEKLQWLKLNDIHPEYKVLVDKLTLSPSPIILPFKLIFLEKKMKRCNFAP